MKSNGKPSISEETITPQIAGTLLGTMRGNRPLRRKAVERYAREMIAGKWRLNGEAVKVSNAGRLIDGQHRLNAVIMANIPVQMFVVRGVDDDAMVTLDTGVGRTYADVGAIRGTDAHRLTGQIARWWYKYLQGSPTVGWQPTFQELDHIVEGHQGIPESAAFIGKLRVVRSRCIPAVQGFVHSYVTEMWDRELADLFMHTLNDGTGLKVDDPVYLLRRRLVDDDSKGRIEGSYVLALTIKAWEAWITGQSLKSLRWRSTGESAEPFPRFSRDVVPAHRHPDRVAAARENRAAVLRRGRGAA